MASFEEEDEVPLEDYKILADQYKDQGNEEFQKGNIEEAINLFTQAIDLDPDNHIYYSNRSACYMKIDSISKSLHDAEKCIELQPLWAKGYNRLGTAQQALKRYDQAIDSFKKGIEYDPNNKALWLALKSCEDAYQIDKKLRFQEAQLERNLEEEKLKKKDKLKKDIIHTNNSNVNEDISIVHKEDIQKNDDLLSDFFQDIDKSLPNNQTNLDTTKIATSTSNNNNVTNNDNNEDDLLASFFNEVTTTTTISNNKNNKSNNKSNNNDNINDNVEETNEQSKKDESVLTEKYCNQDLGTSQQQCDRILAKYYEWRNLNPYEVLQLGIDATEEDIKFRYKKLSLKVHPDRCRNIDNAREAFEQVKNAYLKLTDEIQKKNIILHIESVIDEYKKDYKKLLKNKKDNETIDYEQELSKRIMKYFAEMESMKRRSEINLRAYSARDKMQEAEEQLKLQKYNEFDKSWCEDNRRDKRIDNWREFQVDPLAKKVKSSHYKEETREVKKHGVIKLETWKKAWK